MKKFRKMELRERMGFSSRKPWLSLVTQNTNETICSPRPSQLSTAVLMRRRGVHPSTQ